LGRGKHRNGKYFPKERTRKTIMPVGRDVKDKGRAKGKEEVKEIPGP